MSVFRTRAKGSWRYQFQLNGRTYQEAGYATRKKALAGQEEKKKELLGPEYRRQSSLTFREACDEYLQYLADEGRTIAYIKDVRWRANRQFLAWFDRPLAHLSKEEIKEHLGARALGVSGRTSNADLALLRSIFNLQIERDRIFYNPTAGIRTRPEPTKKDYVPPLRHYKRLLLAADGRLRFLLELLYETAGRPIEILNLRREDINLSARYLIATHRKTGGRGPVQRMIPLRAAFLPAIRRYLKTTPKDQGYLFLNRLTGEPKRDWRKDLAKAFKKAKVPAFGLSAIRPLKASELKKAGWPLMAIQLFLGHTQAGTTERYIHPDLALDLIRPLMKKL